MSSTMSGVLQWNLKTTLIAIGGSATLLYVMYSLMSAAPSDVVDLSKGSVKKSGVSLKEFKTWKVKDFVEIPTNIKEQMPKVKINEHTLNFKVEGQDVKIYSLRVTPAVKAKHSVTVLLLHGAKYTSKNWQDTQTVQLLGAMGHTAIAIDLPGYGKSSKTKGLGTPQWKGAFLKEFIKHENLGRPVLISPSMSGGFSLPFLMEPKPHDCTERVRGFIPVAPAGSEAYSFGQYNKCETPTMIVYGEKDKSIGLTSLNNLRNLANKEMFPIAGAGHPAYIDKPAEWRHLVYNYMLAIELFGE